MRYSSLKTATTREFSKEQFNGGLNTYNKEDLILDTQMSDGSNVLFKNGTLTSRKGLYLNPNDAIKCDKYEYFYKGLTITDTGILKDNKMHKVAYAVLGDKTSYQTVLVYLVSPEGKLSLVGRIAIQRTSSDIYYQFDNIIFLVGNKTKGCGLYAFLTRKSGNDSIYEVYEFDSSNGDFIHLYDDSFYIPIVQMNGCGNRYLDALLQGGLKQQSITKPENYNMLTPRFKAYFTSDGYSDNFKLPIKKIADSTTVFCRLYISSNSYFEWLIPEHLDEVTVNSTLGKITMRCFRKTGYIAFYDDKGAAFSVPKSSVISSNNLMVEATRFEEDNLAELMGCKYCQVYNTNVFFYGNPQTPSRIYLTQTENPLYFPENMKRSVGNPTDLVTAMAVQNNKLIAFKSREIYRISIQKNETELLSDGIVESETTVFEKNRITLSLVHGSIGCAKRETLTVCGNRLVWLGKDANVYTLATTTYGKENNVYCVSTPIANILKAYSEAELQEAFAFDLDGYYVLYIAQSLYMLNYRIKNFGISSVYTAVGEHGDSISWYVMKLPYQKYYSGLNNNGKLYISCGDTSKKYCVLGRFQGDKDMVLTVENGNAVKKEFAIESNITTKFFDFNDPNTRKNIEEVYISMDFSGQADIILNDGNTEYKQTVLSLQKNLTPIRLMPHFKGVYGISVSVSSKEPICFKGVYIKYKNLV